MGCQARLLGVSLLTLFDAARDAIAVYGIGGLTSYSVEHLQPHSAIRCDRHELKAKHAVRVGLSSSRHRITVVMTAPAARDNPSPAGAAVR